MNSEDGNVRKINEVSQLQSLNNVLHRVYASNTFSIWFSHLFCVVIEYLVFFVLYLSLSKIETITPYSGSFLPS